MPPKKKTLNIDAIKLAPVTLLKGSEGYFVDAATDRLRELATERDPAVEIIWVDASVYEPNMLHVWTSPSLFDERRHIVVDALEATNDAFLTDMIDYVTAVSGEPDTTIVLRHQKGTRGKRLLDLIAKRKFPVIPCEPLTRETDKVDFAAGLFRRAQRDASPDALRALVEATGSDLRELASACKQLVADTTGRITPDVVDTYYGGRVETTGFKVADAAVAGNATTAVTLLRHALATGVDPVPIVAVLASKLRTMALVSANHAPKLPPWQVDRARRELRGWSPSGLAEAIIAVADADAAVKGESREPEFAVERAVLTIAGARGH